MYAQYVILQRINQLLILESHFWLNITYDSEKWCLGVIAAKNVMYSLASSISVSHPGVSGTLETAA